MSEGIATINPNSVVINASEMPPDTVEASPVPKIVIIMNVLIIPDTVPSSPSNGAMAALVAIAPMN